MLTNTETFLLAPSFCSLIFIRATSRWFTRVLAVPLKITLCRFPGSVVQTDPGHGANLPRERRKEKCMIAGKLWVIYHLSFIPCQRLDSHADKWRLPLGYKFDLLT